MVGFSSPAASPHFFFPVEDGKAEKKGERGKKSPLFCPPFLRRSSRLRLLLPPPFFACCGPPPPPLRVASSLEGKKGKGVEKRGKSSQAVANTLSWPPSSSFSSLRISLRERKEFTEKKRGRGLKEEEETLLSPFFSKCCPLLLLSARVVVVRRAISLSLVSLGGKEGGSWSNECSVKMPLSFDKHCSPLLPFSLSPIRALRSGREGGACASGWVES